MKAWLVSIAVASTLSAIADMLLPRSAVSRYAKLCISLMLTVVIVRPLIGIYNKDFTFELPQTEIAVNEADTSLIDGEFSARLTELLIADTGIENLSISAKLGYDQIKSVVIYGALPQQEEQVNNVLSEKYNIPPEIVTYGAN